MFFLLNEKEPKLPAGKAGNQGKFKAPAMVVFYTPSVSING
jgi:hypothetical protein